MSKFFNPKFLSDAVLPMGLFLLASLFFILLLATVGLLLTFPLKAWIVPAAIVFAAASVMALCNDKRLSLTGVALGLVVMAVSALANMLVYDVVYDTILYHGQSIAMLGEGWNPVYEEAPNKSIWSTHYAKAFEIMHAAMLTLLGNIQAARCVNTIFAIAGLALAWSAMKAVLTSVSRKWRILTILLLAANPILIWQLPTTYNDFAIWIETILLLSGFLFAWRNPGGLTGYAILFLTMVIAVNTKFTHFFYTGLECIFLAAWALLSHKPRIFRRGAVAVSAAVLIGVFIVGFNPYVTNTVTHRNPFYPLAGGPIDLAQLNAVPMFSHGENLVNFFKSLLSVKGSPWAFFTGDFPIEGVRRSYGGDMFVNGFGLLMFPMLLCGLTLMFVSRCRLRWWIAYLCVFGACLFFYQSWWARYIAFLWLDLILPIVLSLYYRHNVRLQRWLRAAIFTMAMVNASASVAATAYSHLSCTLFYNYVFSTQRRIGKPIVVFKDRPLLRQQFREQGAEYVVVDSLQQLAGADGQLFRFYGMDYFRSIVKLPADDYPELYRQPTTPLERIARYRQRMVSFEELQR